MDFEFTEEQRLLRQTVRDFAEREIAPHVMEWDEAQRFPTELVPELAALGEGTSEIQRIVIARQLLQS